MISQTGYLLGITEQTCVINSGLNVDQVCERQLDLGIEKRWTRADQLKWAGMAFRSQSTCHGWLQSHIRHSPSPITLACQWLVFRIASQTWCVVNGASYVVVSKQQIFSPGPMAFPWLFWPTLFYFFFSMLRAHSGILWWEPRLIGWEQHYVLLPEWGIFNWVETSFYWTAPKTILTNIREGRGWTLRYTVFHNDFPICKEYLARDSLFSLFEEHIS